MRAPCEWINPRISSGPAAIGAAHKGRTSALTLIKILAKRGRSHMTEPAQTRVSDVAPVHPRAPRSERRFFELVGPALKNQPLTFLCEDREYRYGSSAEPTVIRISDSGVFDRIL